MKYFFTSEGIKSTIDNSSESLKIYALKGSCPLIKSKLIYDIVSKAENDGLFCEKFLSEIDYDKLACVYIKGKSCLVYDLDYISHKNNAGKIFDIDKLIGFDAGSNVAELNAKKQTVLSLAAREKNSASLLQKNNNALIMKYVSKPKILNYILRFIQRNKIHQLQRQGVYTYRSISSITAWGVHSFYETILEGCTRIFTVSGKLKAVSSLLISGLAEAFVQYGYDVTVFRCSVSNEYEHLSVPALSLAFVSDNDYHSLPYGQCGNICCERFLKSKIAQNVCFQAVINEEQIDDYISKAVFSMYDAMEIERKISDIMFDEQNELYYKILKPMIISEILGNN